MKRLTALNGKTHRTWLNRRLRSGEIIIEQINYNDMAPTWKRVTVTSFILGSLNIYESSNNEIVGWIGTSYNYRFFYV